MIRLDFIAIAPLMIVAVTASAAMLMTAFRRRHGACAMLTLAGLTAALAAVPAASGISPQQVTSLLIVDGYALFYWCLILLSVAVITVMAYGYLEQQDGFREEFYILLLLAALGSCVLVSSRHFAALFLGLEILSISLYGLIAYTRSRPRSIEAGIKYLVLAAVSTAFLLFGVALVYAASGSLDFTRMVERLQAGSHTTPQILVLAGIAMILVGIGFKLALVPFHMWTPDVYQGAPAPVTALVATISKGAVAALLVRLFAPVDLNHVYSLFVIFALLSAVSMVAGNLLALLQQNVKRMLAYSSIAHMGYLMVAFLTGGKNAAETVTFYLLAYTIGIIGCFSIITVLSGKNRDAEEPADYRGLFYRSPWLAVFFTAMLLSLAGIPMTAGFFGKFFIMAAGSKTALWMLVMILVLTSGIGVFYYLRLVVILYAREAYIREEGTPARVSMPAGLAFSVLAVLLVWLGIDPTPFINLIRQMMG